MEINEKVLITELSYISLPKQQRPSQSHKTLKSLKNKQLRQEMQRGGVLYAELKSVLSLTLRVHKAEQLFLLYLTIIPFGWFYGANQENRVELHEGSL